MYLGSRASAPHTVGQYVTANSTNHLVSIMAQLQCTDISNGQDLEGKIGNTVLLVTCVLTKLISQDVGW